ncbi:hypothetical protein HYH03_012547 [Edaphochlamys debaryana]|uniref:Protein kinase domain-containing protein n=1 Tax=Edaphochlamys debaryana TaxID=47281 RepID=A0A835XSK9_9CHLO|nr:hypothetical protein HYH03_012547 [Edaphochlamys debaryana]|eukprot:KAG2488925.1 hypothetical protein HYH03_012547 [Edaphochlamys debaryana]
MQYSPGGVLVVERCVHHREVGLPLQFRLVNTLAAPRYGPGERQIVELTNGSAPVCYDSTRTPRAAACFPQAILIEDYAAEMPADNERAFQGITLGGYIMYSSRTTYVAEKFVPDVCLRDLTPIECIRLVRQGKTFEPESPVPPPLPGGGSPVPVAAPSGSSSDATTLAIAIAVPVGVVCLAALAAFAFVHHRRAVAAAAALAAASLDREKTAGNTSVTPSMIAINIGDGGHNAGPNSKHSRGSTRPSSAAPKSGEAGLRAGSRSSCDSAALVTTKFLVSADVIPEDGDPQGPGSSSAVAAAVAASGNRRRTVVRSEASMECDSDSNRDLPVLKAAPAGRRFRGSFMMEGSVFLGVDVHLGQQDSVMYGDDDDSDRRAGGGVSAPAENGLGQVLSDAAAAAHARASSAPLMFAQRPPGAFPAPLPTLPDPALLTAVMTANTSNSDPVSSWAAHFGLGAQVSPIFMGPGGDAPPPPPAPAAPTLISRHPPPPAAPEPPTSKDCFLQLRHRDSPDVGASAATASGTASKDSGTGGTGGTGGSTGGAGAGAGGEPGHAHAGRPPLMLDPRHRHMNPAHHSRAQQLQDEAREDMRAVGQELQSKVPGAPATATPAAGAGAGAEAEAEAGPQGRLPLPRQPARRSDEGEDEEHPNRPRVDPRQEPLLMMDHGLTDSSSGQDKGPGGTGGTGSAGSPPQGVAAELAVMAAGLKSTINDVQLTLEGVLGSGSFGTWQGLPVAVKTVVFSASQDNRKRALQEAALCQSISHPNIVATYSCDVQPLGAVVSSSTGTGGGPQVNNDLSRLLDWRLYIVMEFADAGPLKKLYGDPKLWPQSGAVHLAGILGIASGIAEALAHLHSKRIIHGDLNPNNVLLKQDPNSPSGVTVKVADLGLSVLLPFNRTHISHLRVGTPFYIDPVVVFKARPWGQRAPLATAGSGIGCVNGHLSYAADVFSLGVMLWELYHGHPAGTTTAEGPRYCPDFPSFPPSCPEAYRITTHYCLQREPQNRPSASTVADWIGTMRRQLTELQLLQGQQQQQQQGQQGHLGPGAPSGPCAPSNCGTPTAPPPPF